MRCLLLPVLLMASAAASAALPPALLRFAEGLRTLEGHFEQQSFDPDGRIRERAEGEVALAAPDRFRWDYRRPYVQTIVADGERIWVHDPELEQVSVRSQKREGQGGPLVWLADPQALEQRFIVEAEPAADGLAWIRLSPRQAEDAQVAEARIGFEGDEIREMQLVDALGQRSVLRFSGWRRNGSLDPERFRFHPPPGVDVVGEDTEDE
ncbi:MAG: outer-membrane lipoprotein carrier protein [Lysobacteraceae bacterium]|nr:MAG: outer-membrane lipoprotein carrier protein [Xanthomonadaceae bacterium]